MKILIVNPNSTVSMTEGIAEAARAAVPGNEVAALTNQSGPPAIQGPEDGAASVPGTLALLAAHPADAAIIACADDTGLADARAASAFPVLGIGQAGYLSASVFGRFSVVTTLAVSVPVLEENISAMGLGPVTGKVRASGVPVLALETDAETSAEQVKAEAARAFEEDQIDALVLGCAGMAHLAKPLSTLFQRPVIDGVAAAARLAVALAGLPRA